MGLLASRVQVPHAHGRSLHAELSQLHLLCSGVDFLLHDRPGPEEAELLRCVLDLGWGSPGCWQRWLHCWRRYQHYPGRLLEH
jgi:hypothetical protein